MRRALPPAQAAGEFAKDQIRWWHFQNVARKVRCARKLLDDEGLKDSDLPASFLVPWLRAAADVDDSTLDELWARLLASAANQTDASHPVFIAILKQLSPTDARFLQKLVAEDPRARHWLPSAAAASGPYALSAANLKALNILTWSTAKCGDDNRETPEEKQAEDAARQQRFAEVYTPGSYDPDDCINCELSPLGYAFVRVIIKPAA